MLFKNSKFLNLLLLLTLFSYACLVKPENAETGMTPLERAKLNPMTRDIPFNEQSPDQFILRGSDLPSDPSVRKGTLRNGMNYYLKNNKFPANRINLRLVVKTRGMDEIENQYVLYDMLAHFALKGSANFDNNKLSDFLKNNCLTANSASIIDVDSDGTIFQLELNTNKASQIDSGLLVLKDWAMGIQFATGQFERIKKEMIVASLFDQNATKRIRKEYFMEKYGDTKYADLSIDYDPEIIQQIRLEELIRFYEQSYLPGNMAVVIAGDIDPAELEIRIKNNFEKLSGSSGKNLPADAKIVPKSEAQFVVISDLEEPMTSVKIDFAIGKTKLGNQKELRRSIEQELFVRAIDMRLKEMSFLFDVPLTNTSCKIKNDIGGVSVCSISANTFEGKSKIGLKHILFELEKIRRYGFLEAEIDRQKLALLKEGKSDLREQNNTESEQIASIITDHFLMGTLLISPSQFYSFLKVILPQIEIDEFNEKAVQWLDVTAAFYLISGPEKENIDYPGPSELNKLIAEVTQDTLEAFSEEVPDLSIFKTKHDNGKIEIQNRNEDLGIDYIKFENGIQVYLKNTDFKKDEVLFTAFAKGGASSFASALCMPAEFAPELVLSSGLGDLNSINVAKILFGKKIDVSPYVLSYEHGIFGKATPEDIETAIQLINLYLTAPRFDTTALQNLIKHHSIIEQNAQLDPINWFEFQFNKILPNKNDDLDHGSNGQIKSLDLEKMESAYQQLFSDPSDLTFIFVGNINKYVLFSRLSKYLGSIPANPAHFQSQEEAVMERSNGYTKKEFNHASFPVSLIKLKWQGDFTENPDHSYTIHLLSELLRFRLGSISLDGLKAVHALQLEEAIHSYPKPFYSIEISLKCASSKKDRLMVEINEEIERIKNEELEEAEFRYLLMKLLMMHEQNEMTNAFWIDQISAVLKQTSGIDGLSNIQNVEGISLLNPEILQDGANEFLKESNYIEAVLMPKN